MDLVIKWGNDRIIIPFPEETVTLGSLKNELSEKTGLAVDQFKLVHAGAVMKDNNAPLKNYRLKPGSSLTLIGSAKAAPKPRDTSAAAKAPVPRSQESVLAGIKSELENVDKNITPGLKSFLSTLSPPPAEESSDLNPDTNSSPEQAAEKPAHHTHEELKQEHTRLGELLLQSLLRLDAIIPDSEWEEARKARKAAVKQVQADLDHLDTTWKTAQSSGLLASLTSNGNALSVSDGASPTASPRTAKSKSKKRK